MNFKYIWDGTISEGFFNNVTEETDIILEVNVLKILCCLCWELYLKRHTAQIRGSYCGYFS